MRARHPKLHGLTLALVSALAGMAASPASAAVCTWNTTNGNWATIVDWTLCATGNGNPVQSPGGADTAIILSTGVVSVTSAQAINTLNNAGSVSVANNVAFSLNARTAAASIFGGGELVLGGPGSRLFMEGSFNTTLASGSTVRGAGQIGQAVFQSGAASTRFINQGAVAGDVAGQSLILLPVANAGSYSNEGLFEARNGGTLDLQARVIQSTSGLISAQNGSVVVLAGARVEGGTLSSAGTGVLRASGSGSNALSATTLSGVLDMTTIANARMLVQDGLSFSAGAVNIGSSGALSFDSRGPSAAVQAIGGTGTINLAGGRIFIEGGGQTTLGSNIIIRGSGVIGQGIFQTGNHLLINNGLISADVSGQTLQILPPANGSQAVQNIGILEATGGGRLLLSANITAAGGSQLRAAAGSTIEQNGVTVTGTVNTSGGGVFAANASGSNRLSNVTLNGVLDMTSIATSRELVSDGLMLNGSINIGSSGALSFDSRGPAAAIQTIGGTGTINMAGGRIYIEGAGQTTLGSNMIIRGSGVIGQGVVQTGNHLLINNGLISADVSGQTLQIVPPANGTVQALQNNGILEATGGGKLLLSANIDGAPGSQLRAAAGSTIEQGGVTVTGTINTSGGGVFAANASGSNRLSNVTLNGVLDMTSLANSREQVSNGLILNGSVNIANGGALTFDSRSPAAAAQIIGGSGTINLAAGTIFFEGAGQTALGSNIGIRGSGNIGQAVAVTGSHLLINDGSISADVAGQTLQILAIANGGQAVQNNGSLQASNGGRLLISTGVAGGAASSFNVASGSSIVQNGVTFSGVVNQTGTGAISVTFNGNNRLEAVSFNGVLDMSSLANSRQQVSGGLALNGRINIGNGGALSFDSRGPAPANQAVSGIGTVALTSGTLYFEGAGQTTWGSGITVRGSGNIGQAVAATGAHTLVNNGTLLADGGTLNVLPIANIGGISGSGTLQVAGGTLNLATGMATTQGRVLMGATGTLSTGNQNITLNTDYINDQASNGNSFARRAGITGTGLILAGGNATQAITGAGVSNGTTANATLTIGNVRVGSTTFNYQLANTGTTGPTLRGAIQTNVNGGDLTDGRLSGAGVTASNYSTGAPGSNSGNLGVSFAVASAGAIAPLTGQVLNFTSNFSNIAAQKLNIVVGTGAAAYNAAVGAATPTPVILAAQRVGGSLSQALTVANTAPAGAFSEDLSATFVNATGGATNNSGSRNNILAGTNNTGTGSMTVGVDTITSGAKSGTVVLAYQSTGAVNSVSNGLGTLSVGNQTTNVSGNVYAPAVAPLTLPAVNFGTVRVGTVVTPLTVTAANSANGALNDTLRASLSGGALPFTASGTAASIAAGNSDSTSMTVALNTSTADVFSSNATVTFTSQNPEMIDLALGTPNVALNATVNNLAASSLAKTGGAGGFIGGGTSYTLNFGTILEGSGIVSTGLSLSNIAGGPADALAGSFILTALAGTPFSAISGFSSFTGVAAGGSLAGGMLVGFNTDTLGAFSSSITFNPLSTNLSQADLTLAAVTLNLEGSVVAIPEPGTWALWLAGLALMSQLVRRRVRQA